jgi:hypothetical protein
MAKTILTGKEKVKKNAVNANTALKSYAEHPNGVPFFHLRATGGGITLVSTHKDKAMRGITKIATSRCIEMLDMAANAVNNTSTDWFNIYYKTAQGNKKTFPERSQKSLDEKKEKEFIIQAWLINEIVAGNPALLKKLNVSDIFLLGSEIIWQDGNLTNSQRIDIVAHDGKGKVLFLELKDVSNKTDDPDKQVLEYVKIYNNDGEFKKFLKSYPSLPAVEKVKSFEGWVVIGDCNKLNIEDLIIRKQKK